jgi:hypothetical protein
VQWFLTQSVQCCLRWSVRANFGSVADVQEAANACPRGVLVRRSLLIVAAIVAAVTASSAQTDLDAFMSQVLTRRDDNWKKLQQYVLDEDETFLLTGPDAQRLYGSHREYTWFPRDGVFIRSPVKADGVSISEDERRKAEERWLREEQGREKRRIERENKDANADDAPPSLDDLVRPGNEPRFVSTAYFMRFKFEPGHYALVGRERLLESRRPEDRVLPGTVVQRGAHTSEPPCA